MAQDAKERGSLFCAVKRKAEAGIQPGRHPLLHLLPEKQMEHRNLEIMNACQSRQSEHDS
jgi:hypothetical protein